MGQDVRAVVRRRWPVPARVWTWVAVGWVLAAVVPRMLGWWGW